MSQYEKIRELQARISLYEDVRSFGKLYILLYDDVFRYSYRLLKSRECAEEVVSDVFIKLWKQRSLLSRIKNLKLYLYKASKNYSLNYIMSISNKDALKAKASLYLSQLNHSASPEDICISNESVMIINSAIQSLPSQCRSIFHLVKEEGLQYKDVASIMNISAYTVRNQMNIAIKKIDKYLRPVY